MELHQLDFKATDVIDWEECFANKTVETHVFESYEPLFKHSFKDYINKTVDDKDPLWLSGWNRNMLGQETS